MSFAVKENDIWVPAEGVESTTFVDALKVIVEELSSAQATFTLKETRHVTSQFQEDGRIRYKKKPFPMGDRFTLFDVYRGKRGALVFCFESDSGPRDAKQFEFTEMEAHSLEGFPEFLEQVMKALNGVDIEAEAREEAERERKREAATIKNNTEKYGEAFGSW